jgi:polyisoprenoid-binding protein YceI
MNTSARTLAFASLLSALAFAAPMKVNGGTVSYTAKGNMGMSCDGSTTAFTVDQDDKNVTITVQAATLDSKLELRDKHIKENYLHTDKFPTATLVIEKACLALPESGEKSGECPAAFTMHGTTHGTQVKYTAKVSGGTTEIQANFTARMAQHGIPEVKWQMIKIKDDVEVKANFKVAR